MPLVRRTTRPGNGVTASGICGAVLAGGSSSRFGSDKFLHPFERTTMGRRAIEVLARAGAERVLIVSADPDHDTHGALRVAGAREGNGPLGALVDTFEFLRSGTLVTLPCDVPLIRATDVASLLASCRGDVDVVLAEADGIHPTVASWNVERCLAPLRTVYDGGERALHRAVEVLRRGFVVLPAERLLNVNTCDDLADVRGSRTR